MIQTIKNVMKKKIQIRSRLVPWLFVGVKRNDQKIIIRFRVDTLAWNRPTRINTDARRKRTPPTAPILRIFLYDYPLLFYRCEER